MSSRKVGRKGAEWLQICKWDAKMKQTNKNHHKTINFKQIRSPIDEPC